MITKKRAEKCTAHFCACDCREYRYQQMESALKAIRAWSDYRTSDGHMASTPDDIARLCNRALAGIEVK